MSVICALMPLLAACAAPAPPPATSPPAMYTSLASASAVLDAGAARDLINGYRRNQNLPPLVLDQGLIAVAARQSAAMAAGGDVSRGARTDVLKRLQADGVKTTKARESVSAGYFTISDAFSGWRGSPVHDATLRLEGARRMGIAAQHRQGSRHHVYWTLIVSD
ncbi:MAG: CAP domain-containing protein [Beijerinckiaceae bacterium]